MGSVELVIALDFDSEEKALNWVSRIPKGDFVLKVGLELFTASGPSVVRRLTEMGHRIFLDLKLHDIPNTVAKAVTSVGELRVDFLTVHASGGGAMLRAAEEARHRCAKPPRLLAVTALTSFDSNEWNQLAQAISDQSTLNVDLRRSALNLATLTHQSGVGGVVCSAHELETIRKVHPQLFTMVPGIRPLGSDSGDQKRVVTPAAAKQMGANAIVVGRPITQAPNPAQVIQEILREIR